MPKKTSVLDTNIPLDEPEAILKFEDNDVYIPITIIEELDGLKKDREEFLILSGRR
jgi:PhoH-like ATPase